MPARRTTTVVVMGVSGSGKTTVGRALADRLGWAFLEGDDEHPAGNVAKMAAGEPLTDADRLPWLRRIAAWIGGCEQRGVDAVVACSALRRSYRDLLRDGHPSVVVVQVDVDPTVLRARLARRSGHWMPPELLASQLATLEPRQSDEAGLTVPAGDDVTASVEAVAAALPRQGG